MFCDMFPLLPCRLILGDGTDMHPCIISFSSRALLSVVPTLNTCLVPVVFHMDSTFKCNENEFPVTAPVELLLPVTAIVDVLVPCNCDQRVQSTVLSL